MAKKILLADDSITIQKVVELTFSDGDYEVVAVNNGAKAIQKLSEIRPDIILSDIIMPEKNGYEVCEFVKSRPEFRNIPVILLTGTFEPFDPDRADKAGCDAVVTKPFESQSLIHKVDELIQQSASSAGAAPSPAEPASAPWAEPAAPPPPPFAPPVAPPPPPPPQFAQPVAAPPAPAPFAPPPFAPPPAAEPFGSGFQQHEPDVFGAAAAPKSPAGNMPFETAAPEAFSGETRTFPRMTFEDLQAAKTPAAAPPPAAAAPPLQTPEPSPWDEAPASAETNAFPPMSSPVEAPPPAAAEPSPWDEAPPAFSGETRAFQKMSFEDLQRQAEPPPPPPAPTPAAPPAAPSPWDEQPPAFSGETRAFPRMSFDDLKKQEQAPPSPLPPPVHEPPPAAEPSPWDEQPAAGGETRTFPRMSFDDLQKMAASTPLPEESAPARADSSLWDEPAASAPAWSAAPEAAPEAPSPAESFSSAPPPFAESVEPEASPFSAEAPASSMPEPEPEAEKPELTSVAGAAAAVPAASTGELTDEQIERIARRVVQLISNDVVKNIAWEVVPDIAEMIVKERIRQLETEA